MKLLWRHVTLGTFNSWLPGDARGWRSRNHKIHSSGCHRAPPPAHEHAQLREYQQSQAASVVSIPAELRSLVGQALINHLASLQFRVLAAAVAAVHVHLQVQLPMARADAMAVIGRCKRVAWVRVRDCLPKLWSKRGGMLAIRDIAHQRRVFRYITAHRDQHAWVWTYRDESQPQAHS